MPPLSEPTLGEIGRQIFDVKEDIRALRGDLVSKDVYHADQRLIDSRIGAIETALAVSREDRRSLHRMVLGAITAAGLALIVNLVSPLIQSGLAH